MRPPAPPARRRGRLAALVLLPALLGLATARAGEEGIEPAEAPQASVLLDAHRVNLLFPGQSGRVRLATEQEALDAALHGEALELGERRPVEGAWEVRVRAVAAGQAALVTGGGGREPRTYLVAVPDLSYHWIVLPEVEDAGLADRRGLPALVLGETTRTGPEPSDPDVPSEPVPAPLGWTLDWVVTREIHLADGGHDEIRLVQSLRVLGIPPPASTGAPAGVLGILDEEGTSFRRAWARVVLPPPDVEGGDPADPAGPPPPVVEVARGDLVLLRVPWSRSYSSDAAVDGAAVSGVYALRQWVLLHAVEPGEAGVEVFTRHWREEREGREAGRGSPRPDAAYRIRVLERDPGEDARATLSLLVAAVQRRQDAAGERPATLADLRTDEGEASGHVVASDLVDPWGTRYRLEALPDGEVIYTDSGDQVSPAWRVVAAGPDRAFGTADDLVASQPERGFERAPDPDGPDVPEPEPE